MFCIIQHGENIPTILSTCSDFEVLKKFAKQMSDASGCHYKIIEMKNIWTTISPDEWMFASNDHSLEIKRKQKTPVNEWLFYPNKKTPVEVAPTAPVKSPAADTFSNYEKHLHLFNGPMPNELKNFLGYISLNKASRMLRTQNFVLMRLAEEGKLVMHNNGQTGNARRYRIPAAHLRRLFKVKQGETA